MTNWSVEFSPEAERDLARLDRGVRRRVIDRLEWLADNFDSIIPLALGGEWVGFHKLRVADWRIIYQIDWQNHRLIIRYIDRRDKIYKR